MSNSGSGSPQQYLKSVDEDQFSSMVQSTVNMNQEVRILTPLDDPPIVHADQADFLRDADYVVGLVVDGIAHAYPVNIINYYHLTNDMVAGKPVVMMA